MLKSFFVVIGCYMLSVALVFGSGPLLSIFFSGEFAKGNIPSTNALLASSACFAIVSIVCAWLCARLAPGRAARHVSWFFLLGELMGIGATIPNWNKGFPHWYWLSWLVIWPVGCWIGLLAAGQGIASKSVVT